MPSLRGFLVILIALWIGAAFAEEKRVALVMGNGDYAGTARLENTVNDAGGVAEKLESLGFEVTLARELDRRSTIRALDKFGRDMAGSKLALFYYAGHGVQIAEKNYLLPLDVDVKSERALRYSAIDINDIVAEMERSADVSVIILDACRDNPYLKEIARSATSKRGIGISRGLGAMDLRGSGTIVAYAASTGKVASDGEGAHSPYTDALLKEIDGPGIEIGLMFRRVAARVIENTRGEQRPELLVRLLNEVYLNPADGERVPQTKRPSIGESAVKQSLLTRPLSPLRDEPPPPEFLRRRAKVFPVGKWPEGIVLAEDSLWIAESGQRTIARMDPDTGKVKRRLKVGRLPVGLVSPTDDRIYAAVATDRKIWQQPTSGAKGSVLAKLADHPQAITGDIDTLWALTWVGGSSGQTRVVRIDRDSGDLSESGDLPRNGFDLVSGADTLWVLHRYDGENLCELIGLDKRSLREVSRTTFTGFVFLLTAGAGGVFAAGGEFGKQGLIVKFDPQTGQEIVRFDSDQIISSVISADEYLVAIDSDGAIYVFSSGDLSLLRKIELVDFAYEPRDLIFVGDELYITTHRGNGPNGSVLNIADWRPN